MYDRWIDKTVCQPAVNKNAKGIRNKRRGQRNNEGVWIRKSRHVEVELQCTRGINAVPRLCRVLRTACYFFVSLAGELVEESTVEDSTVAERAFAALEDFLVHSDTTGTTTEHTETVVLAAFTFFGGEFAILAQFG